MKQLVRFFTFETNSSTTHTMVIIPDEMWEGFKNNKFYYLDWTPSDLKKEIGDRDTISREELENTNWFKSNFKLEDWNWDEIDIEEYPDEAYESAFNYFIDDNGMYTYDSFNDSDYLEVDENEYKSKSGDVIHIMCRYGRDG